MTSTLRVVGITGLVLCVPIIASAALFRTGDTVDIRTGEAIPEDVYAAGGTITSGGVITGDLYAAGGTVLVTGPVSTDAVIGGGTVTITSAIGDDLRIGGGTIVVQGTVGGDVVAGGGQIHLAGRSVGGDVLAGGGMLTIDAPVAGNIKAGGGEVRINAPVGGNVEIEAEKITIGSGAVISGNFTYKSPKEAVVEQGAQIRGQTTYTPSSTKGGTAAVAAIISIALIVKVLMLLAGAMLFGLIFKRFSEHLVHGAFRKPLLEIGRGLIVMIVLPVVSILLFVTVIGIPIGILGLISFVALMIFSWFMAPILLGSFIHQWFTKGEYEVNWKSILIGVVAFCILGLVPLLGGLIQFILMILALGVIARIKWEETKEWR